jgi:S-adenosylmethionine:tRNA ribosyltransferase-isomerase
MKVTDFDYELPVGLIAQEPVEPRDASRLMLVDRHSAGWEHRCFRDLPAYLRAGDLLVLNHTRVRPARLFGHRADTGGKIEVVLLRHLEQNCWEVLVRPGKKAGIGTIIIFVPGKLAARVMAKTDAGGRVLEFFYQGDFRAILNEVGQVPLPPYIKKALADPERYQVIYGRHEGSAAAPTAGLHFTPGLMAQLAQQGIGFTYVLLHIGLGTFRPVRTVEIENHRMHAEYFEITETAAATINQVKQAGGRVVAVGTTAVRVLETVADASGCVHPGSGWTDIFIYPGYWFQVVDALITNFHLPCSTLLMLVSAFAGRERVLAAYREAVDKKYRFFSFGDAMFIV